MVIKPIILGHVAIGNSYHDNQFAAQ